jgi:hypothetical protein
MKGFGVYQLNEIDYRDGIIKMFFTNAFIDDKAEINIDIKDKLPQVFIICWDDIKEMVYRENESNEKNEELLEFDFE